jgi:hypothetical protein
MYLEKSNCKRLHKYVEELLELSDKCRIGIVEDGKLKPYTDSWSVNGYAEIGLCLKYKKEYIKHSMMYYDYCISDFVKCE